MFLRARGRGCYILLQRGAGRRRPLASLLNSANIPPPSPPRGQLQLPPFEALAMLGVATVGVATLVGAAYESPMPTCRACDAEYRPFSFRLLGDKTASALVHGGEVVVLDGVLGPEALAEARHDVRGLKDRGWFKANANDDEDRRSDSVCWVTGEEEEGQGLGHCIRLLRGIAHELQLTQPFRDTRLVVQQAAQLACYDGEDSHYNAHMDAQTDTLWSLGLLEWLRARMYRQRTVTAILYLNDEHWDCDKQGGALRCYSHGQDQQQEGGRSTSTAPTTATSTTTALISLPKAPHAAVVAAAAQDGDGAESINTMATIPPRAIIGVVVKKEEEEEEEEEEKSAGYTDVAPKGGRLVLFNSRKVLHEVLPTHSKERMALTVWIGDENY